MLKEKDIIHESGKFWVLKIPTGKLKGTFEVYKDGITHATRCAIIGFKGKEGLDRAIVECNKRAASCTN